MPVVISSAVPKSKFEITRFDAMPAKLNFASKLVDNALGQVMNFTDEDLRYLAGAPGGAEVRCEVIDKWGYTGADRPLPGLYFFTSHPSFIEGENTIGICFTKGLGYSIYIKDVFYNDVSPSGIAAVGFARIVRFCLKYGITKIRLLAAGGRDWPDITNPDGSPGRWGGYYFWVRCGFNMNLSQEDIDLSKNFLYPRNLSACTNVRSVVKKKGGLEWWKVCGSGDFMEFDVAPGSSSVVALEGYLAEKGF